MIPQEIGWGNKEKLLYDVYKELDKLADAVAQGSGAPGTSGTSGHNGTSGTNGSAGASGTSGSSGTSGGGGGLSYKVYIAHIRQTSPISNPVATVFENTLGGTVVWNRVTNGYFQATLANTFILNKTWVLATPDFAGGTFIVAPDPTANPPDNLDLYNTDGGAPVDGLDCYIEIRVYP